jgi:hypothetical protein
MKQNRKCFQLFRTKIMFLLYPLIKNLLKKKGYAYKPIINNYQNFVNGIVLKIIISQKNYLKNSYNFIATKAIPAPIRGPTATPLKSDTANMVPRTNAVVI